MREMYGRSEPTDDEIRSIVRDTYAEMLCVAEKDISGKRYDFSIADVVGKVMDMNPFLMNHRYVNILQEESAILTHFASEYLEKHPELFAAGKAGIRRSLDETRHFGNRRRHIPDRKEPDMYEPRR